MLSVWEWCEGAGCSDGYFWLHSEAITPYITIICIRASLLILSCACCKFIKLKIQFVFNFILFYLLFVYFFIYFCLFIYFFSPTARTASSIILRGPNDFYCDEMERSIHDALCVVKRVLESGSIVCGGGAVEAALSVYLENFATSLVNYILFKLWMIFSVIEDWINNVVSSISNSINCWTWDMVVLGYWGIYIY